jgi:hypothetical protein
LHRVSFVSALFAQVLPFVPYKAANMGAGAAMMATLDDSQIDGLDAGQVDSVVAALREENISLKKFIASEDAEAVFKATDGLGTDEMRLVEVLCKRTKVCSTIGSFAQRLRCVLHFCCLELLLCWHVPCTMLPL